MKVHFIGINGSGMKGVAVLAAQAGYTVTGSDQRDPDEKLKSDFHKNGVVFLGRPTPENVVGADLVVKSHSIVSCDVEVAAARDSCMPIFTRMQFLERILCESTDLISIIGSFGKSTTTSIVSEILISAKADPTIYAGCTVPSIGASALLGKGTIAVAETCEYFKELMFLRPTYCLLTSIGVNHEDQFGYSTAGVTKLFDSFFSLNQNRLKVIVMPGEVYRAYPFSFRVSNIITYGDESDNWYSRLLSITNERMRFNVFKNGDFFTELDTHLIGEINMKNITGAIALLDSYGISSSEIKAGVGKLSRVPGRFEVKEKTQRLVYVVDNARSPCQITETLKIVKDAYPGFHIVAVPAVWGKINRRELDLLANALSASAHVLVPSSKEFEIDNGGPEQRLASHKLVLKLKKLGVAASHLSDDGKWAGGLAHGSMPILFIFCGYDSLREKAEQIYSELKITLTEADIAVGEYETA